MHTGDGINDFFFTDLLIGEEEALYKIGGNGEFKPVPFEAISDIKAIYAMCCEAEEQDSRVEYKGVKYRSSRMFTISGLRFALRRPMPELMSLSKLGYNQTLIKRLVSKAPPPYGVQHGIIIFTGLTCSGKTTSAGALIAERLTHHGGLAVTIEDPPELHLQGVYGEHGQGRCYQCDDIFKMGGVAATGASVLRFAAPNIVMYGEIRDGRAAAEAIRAGLSGHLVIMTMHSSGIKEAIERLVGYAAEAIGPAASYQLATALSCVVYQRLEGNGQNRLQLYADFLFSTDGIRAKIRERQFHTLETEIMQQRDLMLLTPKEKPHKEDIPEPKPQQLTPPRPRSLWEKITGKQ